MCKFLSHFNLFLDICVFMFRRRFSTCMSKCFFPQRYSRQECMNLMQGRRIGFKGLRRFLPQYIMVLAEENTMVLNTKQGLELASKST